MDNCKGKKKEDCKRPDCLYTQGNKRQYCRRVTLKKNKNQLVCKGKKKENCNGPNCLYTQGKKRQYCRRVTHKKRSTNLKKSFEKMKKKTMENKTIKKKTMENKTIKLRKNVEYNWAELVCAVCLCFHIENKDKPNMKNILDLTKEEIPLLECEHFDEYKTDLLSRKRPEVSKYINVCWSSMSIIIPLEKKENIKLVILSGKICRNPIINEKHKSIQNKRKSCKADIYIIQKYNTIIGLSVKDSPKAPLSNYSVHKIFNNLGLIDETQLKKIKSDFIKLCLPDNITLKQANQQINKGTREEKNRLRSLLNRKFYRKANTDNVYFETIDMLIQDNQKQILESLYSSVLGKELNYPLYEFNGEYMVNLKDISMNLFRNKLQLIRYKLDNTTSAKLYYAVINDKSDIVHKIEIRFKGNIISSSPQIILMSANTDKKLIMKRLKELEQN